MQLTKDVLVKNNNSNLIEEKEMLRIPNTNSTCDIDFSLKQLRNVKLSFKLYYPRNIYTLPWRMFLEKLPPPFQHLKPSNFEVSDSKIFHKKSFGS